MMKTYTGVLGTFEYDDELFEIMLCSEAEIIPYSDEDAEDGMYAPCLMYIGSNTDCSQLEIPPGLLVCDYMFYDTPIELPPKIPMGVVSCVRMFAGCSNLEYRPSIPASVRDTTSMFKDI